MSSRLSWSPRGEELGIAVLAHRAALRGHKVLLTPGGYAGPAALARAAQRFGLRGASGDASGDETQGAIAPPRIVLYCGAAIGYPYYAYYSHCLWSLGLAYRRAEAADIAGGMLDSADLLILPGGFATWGLDRIEAQDGVDDAIRGFLARGGACIGSCGGGFYLSEGRPHWLGMIDAKPRFTHEYLQTGACMLNVRLDDAALRRDLPETVELAYYHGPVYEPGERRSSALGTFQSHIMSTRLFIDNPLEAQRFEQIMRERVAILSGRSPDCRVIAFSPHPEMGEFLRKGMALDGYVRKYLPIRGRKTMEETLRFYAREDCLGFRLVLNAALMLGAFDAAGRAGTSWAPLPRRSLPHDLAQADAAWRTSVAAIDARLDAEEPELAALMHDELQRLREEWSALLASGTAWDALDDNDMAVELGLALADAMAALDAAASRRAVEMLVLLELPVRLLAAVARIARCDRIIGESM